MLEAQKFWSNVQNYLIEELTRATHMDHTHAN
jgi:hypothetical protein